MYYHKVNGEIEHYQRKERKHMKQIKIKKISTVILAMSICLGIHVTAFAAPLDGETSTNTELAEYKETLTENRNTLQGILNENGVLMEEIKTAQKGLKNSNTLTEEFNTELRNMSALIQQKRITLTEKREQVIGLQETSRESMESGDVDAAKTTLEQVINIQAEQIELQNELTDLLEQKLNLLQGN